MLTAFLLMFVSAFPPSPECDQYKDPWIHGWCIVEVRQNRVCQKFCGDIDYELTEASFADRSSSGADVCTCEDYRQMLVW